MEDVAPWALARTKTGDLPRAAALRLPHGLLAAGAFHSRRPTRWLKGLDGVKDFDYGVYAHEARAAAALGPKWGGVRDTEVRWGARAVVVVVRSVCSVQHVLRVEGVPCA